MSFVVLLGGCMQLKVTTYICNKTCHADVACCALPVEAAQIAICHLAADEFAYKDIVAI